MQNLANRPPKRPGSGVRLFFCVQRNQIILADRTHQSGNAASDPAMDATENHGTPPRRHIRTRTRDVESSIHYPLGVMNAQLSVISIHGETITEDYIESVTLCEYCGEEVKPNGKTRSVRTLDPYSSNPYPGTRVVPDFTPYVYTCCPFGMVRYEHSQGFCCCPTGLYRAYVEKGRGNSD